jgi:hypothetical protein
MRKTLDSHEQFLDENPVNFLMKASSITFKVICPSGNRFWMFRGQPKLVKDSRDITFMREHPELFDELPTEKKPTEEKQKNRKNKGKNKESELSPDATEEVKEEGAE